LQGGPQYAIQMGAGVHDGDRLGCHFFQNGNQFVLVVGPARHRHKLHFAGKEPRKRSIVGVQIEALPFDAALA